MLHWLPSVRCNAFKPGQKYFYELLVWVFCVHILIVFVSLCYSLWRCDTTRYHIALNQSGATYVLVPLQKRIDSSGQLMRTEHGHNKKSQIIDYESYQKKQKRAKNRSINSSKHDNKSTNLKSIAPEKKIVKSESVATCVLDDARHKNKKIVKKSKKLKAQKKSTVRIEHKIDSVVELPIETKNVIFQDQKAQSIDENKDLAIEQLSDKTNESIGSPVNDVDLENPIFIGYEQLDEHVIGAKIKHAISQKWSPPIGTPAGTTCELQISVSDQGVACNVMIVKSSGIFIHDSSARKAMLLVEYPPEVCNKQINVILGV